MIDHPTLARPARRQRSTAVALDLASLVLALTVASVLATAWLLVRTGLGRDDVREADGQLAAALVLAAPPAWLAWLAPAILRGVTPGQRRAGLRVTTSARRPRAAFVLRFALHPLAVTLWAWLALAALAAGLAPLAIALGFLAALVATLGVASLVLWLLAPRALPLHDRLARTRLVLATPSRDA